MTNYRLILVFSLMLGACSESDESTSDNSLMPSETYVYTSEDLTSMPVQEKVYVPVYSEIYHLSGERKFLLTITLSVRNVRVDESIFIQKVDYYDSNGKLIREYLEKPIELSALQSVEFVVEYNEKEGGAGANFLVEWCARSPENPPLLQAVMIGSSSQQGISYITEGITIEKKNNSGNLPDSTGLSLQE